jgi:hypothetical protein
MAELILFNNSGIYSGFTPALVSTTYLGITYAPTIVNRSSIHLTDNFAKSTLSFTFLRSHYFAKALLSEMPEIPVTVTLYKNSNPYWLGRVVSAKASGISITIDCESIFTSMARNGLRATLCLNCRHVLYSTNCSVLQESYSNSYAGIIATSSVISVPLIAGVAAGYYNSGIAVMNAQKRRILTNTTTDITLASPFTGTQAGVITLYPGCDLTETMCRTRFNNLPNYGGFARIPTKNPFASNGVL